ncbi:MFS transporter [Kitasatospora sp. NPDC059599]|uniref:MFS transporter n=1 Tax=Kitasatospora sp. NPDC059599 TaxID=3346880 RepID=UPI00368891D3
MDELRELRPLRRGPDLIPLLLERGVSSTTAAWALGLGGLGQTLGRTLYAELARHTSVTTRTVALISAGGATTALLAVIPGPTALLMALAILAGTIRGNLTLLQATAVTDRWDTASYGRLSALLAAPATIAGALAPWGTSALVPFLGGYPALFATLAVIAVVAAAVASTARPRPRATWRTRQLRPTVPGLLHADWDAVTLSHSCDTACHRPPSTQPSGRCPVILGGGE